MDKTQTINVAHNRIKFIAIVFCMSSICSYDHEIMQLTDTGGIPCVSNIATLLGHYKGALQVSPKVSVELAWIKTGICHS